MILIRTDDMSRGALNAPLKVLVDDLRTLYRIMGIVLQETGVRPEEDSALLIIQLTKALLSNGFTPASAISLGECILDLIALLSIQATEMDLTQKKEQG